jgi:signal recognition particle protein
MIAKKADESSFSQILSKNEYGLRDVNAVDSDGRTTLLFVFGSALSRVLSF